VYPARQAYGSIDVRFSQVITRMGPELVHE
jgi:hypothetical protein